jgi:hypothetical protein
LLFVYYEILGRGVNPIAYARRVLKSLVLLPWISDTTPRLYLYSAEDNLVRSMDIEKHVVESAQLGYPVMAEIFHGSSHVSHMRLDPKSYLAGIRRIWDMAHDIY